MKTLPDNFIDVFNKHTEKYPDKIAYIFLPDGKTEAGALTFLELKDEAKKIAAQLQNRLLPGDRIILNFPAGLEFIINYLACLYAGMIAIPVASGSNFEHIVDDSGAKLILSPGGEIENPGNINFATDINLQNITHLQYSSGTTSTPKGVICTQQNLSATLKITSEKWKYSIESITCTWAPHSHVYGLICGLLTPLFNASLTIIIPPQVFLQKPQRWLQAISLYKATHTGCPDFGYAHCVNLLSADNLKDVKLTSLIAAVSGGETVKENTLIKFLKLTKNTGFTKDKFVSAYGMSEFTGLIASNEINEKVKILHLDIDALKSNKICIIKESERSIVSSGTLVDGIEALVVNLDNIDQLPSMHVGEIWLSGNPLAMGYWCRREETATTFVTYHGKKYLRTGDLGFIYEGELYLTGRKKELLIINGKNFYPLDIENLLNKEIFSLQNKIVVAYAVDVDGFEKLIITIGVDKDNESDEVADLCRAIEEVVASIYGVAIYQINFIQKEYIEKTTGGKLKRQSLRDKHMAKKLPWLHTYLCGNSSDNDKIKVGSPVRTDVLKDLLITSVKEVLGISNIKEEDDFFSLGANSLQATRLQVLLQQRLNVHIPFYYFFKYPTINLLVKTINDELKSTQSNLLIPVTSKNNKRLIPVSHAQQRMWILNQVIPDHSLYNISFALKLIGNINIPVLERALNEVIKRHEALRTNFKMHDDKIYQVIREHTDIKINTNNLITNQNVKDFYTDIAKKAKFDLANDLLLNVNLHHDENGWFILVFNFHHIIIDGWSMEIFLNEVVNCYNVLLSGKEPNLPVLPIQYSDFSSWQRAWLQKGIFKQQLAYWEKHLENVASKHEFRHDKAIKGRREYAGKVFEYTLNPEYINKLEEHAKRQQSTLFAALISVFYVLFSRYANKSDLTVGVPVANRHYHNVASLIGFFVNTLPLRINFTGNISFNEFLQQVKKVTLEAYENQDIPFEYLIDAIGIQREQNTHPLFQILFALQDETLWQLDFKDIQAEYFQINPENSKFDLSFVIRKNQNSFVLNIEYSTELFYAETIVNIAQQFEELILTVCQYSDKPLSSLPLLTQEQYQKQVVQWNDTTVTLPKVENIAHLFEEIVQRHPDYIAIVWNDISLTYEQLNHKANQLAHYIIKMGVPAGSLIGIHLTSAYDSIIAMLAILKAGCGYVPFDINIPKARMDEILKFEEISNVLINSNYKDKFIDYHGGIIEIDVLLPVLQIQNNMNPGLKNALGATAYVIFTSGTTGKSKGVIISQLNVIRLVQDTNYFKIKPREIVCQASNLAFDAATFEIWGALLNAATCSILEKTTLLDFAQLKIFLQDKKIDYLFLTTSLVHEIAEVDPTLFNTLKYLYFGGEAASGSQIKKILHAAKYANSLKVIHVYGPTEGTTFSTYYDLDLLPEWANSIPIGKPISNTYCYILNVDLQHVPVGVPGELYIAGLGVASGYLNDNVGTKNKFITTTFKDGTFVRLYRTGDIAYYLSSGDIEFIGRMDNQVKLRGYRIELDEIKNIFLQHSGVKQATVLLQKINNIPRLIAYIVAKTSFTNKFENKFKKELFQLASSLLPNYMVPDSIILLDRMPLNQNLKVDYKALEILKPRVLTRVSKQAYVEPGTDTERQLVMIWCKYLNLNKVSLNDNFFEVGGNSLLAIRVVNAICEEFNINFSLIEFFANVELKLQAKKIENQCLNEKNNHYLIPVIKRPENIPLSFSQHRMWLLSQILSNTTVYNIPIAIKFIGALDKVALRLAINKIIALNESLRTAFLEMNGEATQVIKDCLEIDIGGIDLINRPEDVSIYLRQFAYINLELKTGPLIAVNLIATKSNEHILVLTMHHIIADGWSMDIFCNQLVSLYNSYYLNQSPEISSSRLQYADFSIWQRALLEGNNLNKQISYWKDNLLNVKNSVIFPYDKLMPEQRSNRGKNYILPLDQAQTYKLAEFANENKTTLFITLLSIFYVLLYRYCDQEDIIVGTPVANRHYPQVEDIIGLFVNTLPLRAYCKDGMSFIELLQQVHHVALGAYSNQDTPFDHIVDAINIKREPNYHPLFQIMFALEEETLVQLNFNDVMAERLQINEETAKFDLTLTVRKSGQGLFLNFEYATDVFFDETIKQLAAHYQHLIESILVNPSEKINLLYLLTPTEYQRFVLDLNLNIKPYPYSQPFYVQFKLQVDKNPDAIAAIESNKKISYFELNQLVENASRYLLDKEIKHGDIVAVCADRTINYLAILISLLRIGAIYMPLPNTWPLARIKQVMQLNKINFLVCDDANKDLFVNECGYFIIEDVLTENNLNLSIPSIRHSDAIAYIIFTSGSTGLPKGVVIKNEGMMNHLYAMIDKLKLTDKDIIAQCAGIGFDISIWQFLTILLVGGKVRIYNDENIAETLRLFQMIDKENITILQMVPSIIELILKENVHSQVKLENLRFMIPTGEALTVRLVKSWFEQYSAIPFVNAYGPAEGSDDVSLYFIQNKQQVSGKKTIPVGTAIPNIKLFVLDRFLQPVPIGVVGEIYVGGIGVAKGYLNNLEQTNAAFIKSPFHPDEKLYKTGDLARYAHDGNIEFVGRNDSQIKIHGQRIELAEIESVLLTHNNIENAVVIFHKNDQGYFVLGYVTTDNKLSAYSNEDLNDYLHDYLKTYLPHYMLTSIIIRLDKFPLNDNGKIDRKKLPIPKEILSPANNKNRAPKNQLERQLLILWQQFLLNDSISVADDFFYLGGNSLIATQIISRLRHLYNIEIPVKCIFDYRTIPKLANYIKTIKDDRDFAAIPSIVATNSLDEAPLSFAQQRLWFLEQLYPEKNLYNLPFALELHGKLNLEAMENAFKLFILRHEILRSAIHIDPEGKPYQKLVSSQDFNVNVIELTAKERNLQENTIDELFNKELIYKFNLDQTPLIRVTIVKLSMIENLLVVNMHHIVSDAWSINIFCKEISALYNDFLINKLSTLPVLPIQYRDYAVYQRNWLRDEVLEKQLNYWQQQLADIPDLLSLPIRNIRPKKLSYAGKMFRFDLKPGLVDQIKALCVRSGTTSFMVLMAAFQVLLHRLSGQDDIVVGTPIANRQHEEIENLIGFFVNTLAIRTDCGGNPKFLDLLKQLRETCLLAYAHQDIPFEQLVDYMNASREFNRHPIFQIMFILQDWRQWQFDFHQVKSEYIPIDPRVSKFDLTLFIEEHTSELKIKAIYSTDLYDEWQIKELCHHYEILLEEITSYPNTHINEINLLSPAEYQQQILDWNATEQSFPQYHCLHELFEAQANKTPDAPALVFEDNVLNYQLLNTEANKLAHFLRKQGVKEGSLVAVCLERSLDLVISLLAIQKAGGAYVPLDPEYPASRLLYMLEDSAASITLTQTSAMEKLSTYTGKCVLLDKESHLYADEPGANLHNIAKPDSLCYVIYTSGSTGKPKGVLVTHKNITNYLIGLNTAIPLASCQRFSVISTIAADFSNTIIYGALLSGKTLYIPNQAIIYDPTKLAEFISTKQIDCLKMVPSQLNAFLNATNDKKILPSKVLILGGERAYQTLIYKIHCLANTCQVFNHYGPTETTVGACTYHANPEDDHYLVPIGKPLPNTKSYILDENLNPQPVGVKGQLYISGSGVAKGYLNLPELTDERFIIRFNQRLYKTGDYCRYLPSGDIEYLGRMDNQIKMRGFRIELNEIESVINQHINVENSVVLARENEQDNSYSITAFVTGMAEINYNQGKLSLEFKQYLKTLLPEYMIPSEFIFIKSFPLLGNGKIDISALQAYAINLSKNTPTQPLMVLNSQEKILINVWREVLGRETITLNDNFFEVGGDSLKAVSVVVLAEKQGLSIDIIDIFDYPSVMALAEFLNSKTIQTDKAKEFEYE
jgi:amino acid adenylation domain-containing protein